ncbi:Mitochondrial FAD-linked sulfhydryl oxidase ERV1 [Babesia microti strain RI]|uniref:Sulfhydryl oxidase n=1 Tax=Babesia microti (strain RI) TaxID=1133968 RepID=A0A0K3AMR2_BABMR|nr:Mitochondrial FAD-linked sulfhydryl oxidase ERV1 [Babesia microti strain RI]CTQ40999.1 Mitochondrial FAD-linked sulfhydryl oxidase ERV1 [Babesia microti strain RI]|eukprot:XP_012649010.1 Mitochondrial FAD-linked sulfhydryl oxidase ERV1 [Babesia microti strain RI]
MTVYERCVEASCRDGEKSLYPPSRIQLGRAGWLLLHSISINHNITNEEIETAAWLYSFAALYPCHVCRDSLYSIYKKMPPSVNTQENLILWACEIHNKVNDELSKPILDCNIQDLRKMYCSKH